MTLRSREPPHRQFQSVPAATRLRADPIEDCGHGLWFANGRSAPGACLQLATVDLYVNESNEIVGVNVGLGAP